MNLLVENFSIAFSALWSNKVRSFLTVLGVAIGVFAVISIISSASGLKEAIRSQIIALGADVIFIVPGKLDNTTSLFTPQTMKGSFTVKEIELLREQVQTIKAISGLNELAGEVSLGNRRQATFMHLVEPDFFKIRRLGLVAGEYWTITDYRQQAQVVLLGLKAAQKLFVRPQKAVGQKVKLNGKEFRISGVLQADYLGFGGFDHGFATYVPLSTGAVSFGDERRIEIFAQARSENEIDKAQREIERVLTRKRGQENFTVFTQETTLSLVNQISLIFTLGLTALAAISLVVGGIGIMNIMLVSVTERTREIGIRKAVGASNTHILVQFLIEAVSLCLLGGMIGLLVAVSLSLILTRYVGLPTLINLPTVLGAFSFSVLVGVIFGIAPALRAARKDPIEALRYE